MWWVTKGPWVNLPIYIKVLWIYLFSLTYANFTTTALNTTPFSGFRARPWNLHGAQDFYPCTFKRSSPEVEDPDMIECDQKASQMMGNTIPTIYPDDRVVREIRISIEADLTFIPARAFEYVGTSLHTLTICGGGLRLTRRGAFDGLTQLRKINLTDLIAGESSAKGIAHRLFSKDGELSRLVNLHELILQNVDLSDGLGPGAFDGISSQLYDLRLVNNGLRSIKETAFDGSLCAKSIKRLAIEQQPPNGEWIADLRKWAKDMTALEEVSLSGNDLSTTRELNFGQTVNRALRLLRLENCSLTAIGPRGGLSLERINDHLRDLYVGGNLFNVTDQNSKDALIGVARFSQLQILSFAGNRGNMTRMPDWLGNTTIRSLDLSHTHLQQIGPGDLPKELQTLKLQACAPHELEPRWSQKMVGLRELVLDETDLKTIMVGNTSGDWTTALKPLANTLQTLSLRQCELITETFLSDASDFELARTRIDLLGFSNLRKVLISRNYLTYLPSGTFRSVPRLRELHVRDNLLQSISDPNWSGQYDKKSREDGRLRIIDLTNNAITTLNRCSPALGLNRPLEEMLPLTGEGEGTGLRLMGNPLICDCRLGWLSRYVRRLMNSSTYEGSRALAHSLNFTCIGRGRWAGRRFFQLTPAMLQQEMHPDCSRRRDLYEETVQRSCRSLPTPKLPVETEDSTAATDDEFHYIFRPVRVFGYDAEDHKLWLAVRPDNLRMAWKSIMRQRTTIDAVLLDQILPLARIVQLPPQKIIRIKEDYAIFYLRFWPVEGEEEALHGPITSHVTIKGAGKQEYIFSAQPVYSNRAYTVCLRDALAMKASGQSTICQIFQPSEILGKIKVPTESESNTHESSTMSAIWLWAAAITVSSLLLLLVLLLLIICCYRRKRRREKKRLSASSSESKQRLSSTSAIWVTDSIYATMHGSPARVSLLRDSMQRPISPDDSVYEVLEDFNAGDTYTKRPPLGIGSPSMSERSVPNLNDVGGPRTSETGILINNRRRASSNLPELPRRTPKSDTRIRFRVFGGKSPATTNSASTGDIYHSGCATPRPTTSSRRFIQNTQKPATFSWRTSLAQKIRRNAGEPSPGTRRAAATRKSKSPSPANPSVSNIITNDGFARSPKCTIPSPKLPPPFPVLASEKKDKKGASLENINAPAPKISDADGGYLPMQLPDTPKAASSAQMQQQLDAFMTGAGEAQLTDSYILGGAGSRDFMQSCATGRPGEQFETGVDKRPEPQPPITATKVWKLYSPACATVQPVMVRESEKAAPLCLPEVDSPIENSDSSSIADTK